MINLPISNISSMCCYKGKTRGLAPFCVEYILAKIYNVFDD